MKLKEAFEKVCNSTITNSDLNKINLNIVINEFFSYSILFENGNLVQVMCYSSNDYSYHGEVVDNLAVIEKYFDFDVNLLDFGCPTSDCPYCYFYSFAICFPSSSEVPEESKNIESSTVKKEPVKVKVRVSSLYSHKLNPHNLIRNSNITLSDFLKFYRVVLPDTRIAILQKNNPTDCTFYINVISQDILDIFTKPDIFKEYADLQVEYFTILGGGEFPVDLCICLKE